MNSLRWNLDDEGAVSLTEVTNLLCLYGTGMATAWKMPLSLTQSPLCCQSDALLGMQSICLSSVFSIYEENGKRYKTPWNHFILEKLWEGDRPNPLPEMYLHTLGN